MTSNPLTNATYFEPNYRPDDIVSREAELSALSAAFPDDDSAVFRNVHLSGPRGSGKTHLLLHVLDQLPEKTDTCYVSCEKHDTQYKALQQLYESISGKAVPEGYHTSDLQRRIERKTGIVQRVVVLDEVEFLLQNDGNDLLYFLSRISGGESLAIVTISSQNRKLSSSVEKRVYSSLYPKEVEFEEYSSNELRQILLSRAQHALNPNSLQRKALRYIVSESPNVTFGLHWMKAAAERAKSRVTGSVVKKTRLNAYLNYADHLLSDFTDHHRLIHQAIRELVEEAEDSTILTGEIYTRYDDLCNAYGTVRLSNRRVSDFLKHLELLDLIEAKYHHGGRKGKTREIRPTISPNNDPSTTTTDLST